MAELVRVLWLDLRRTALYLAVPALATIGTYTAWRMLIPGVGYWDNAVAALLAATRVLGPICAGLATWFAVRRRRLDHLRALSQGGTLSGPAIDVLLFGGVVMVAYGLVSLLIVIKTAVGQEAGRLHLMGILAGALTLLAFVLAGYLAGRAVPHLIMAPIVAAAGAVWSITRPASWWRLLPPPAMGRLGLFATLRPAIMTAQAIWSLGLIVALVTAYALITSRRRVLTAPLAVAAAATMGATAWLHGQQDGALSPVSYGSVCRPWPLTICVPPALSPSLIPLEETVTPMATLLEGTPGAFTKAQFLAEDEERPPRDGTVYFFLDNLSSGYAHRVLAEVEISLLDAPVCGQASHTESAHYSALVSAWLLNEPPPPDLSGSTTMRTFGEWTDPQRRTWLNQHYRQFRQCALNVGDFRRI